MLHVSMRSRALTKSSENQKPDNMVKYDFLKNALGGHL